MPGEPEGLTAVLLQLASITQKLAELDQRQAGDARELKERVAALGSLVGELKGTRPATLRRWPLSMAWTGR